MLQQFQLLVIISFIITGALLSVDSRALIEDAAFTDIDLVAEESQSNRGFAGASASASVSAGATASASSSGGYNYFNFGQDYDFDQYPRGPPPNMYQPGYGFFGSPNYFGGWQRNRNPPPPPPYRHGHRHPHRPHHGSNHHPHRHFGPNMPNNLNCNYHLDHDDEHHHYRHCYHEDGDDTAQFTTTRKPNIENTSEFTVFISTPISVLPVDDKETVSSTTVVFQPVPTPITTPRPSTTTTQPTTPIESSSDYIDVRFGGT